MLSVVCNIAFTHPVINPFRVMQCIQHAVLFFWVSSVVLAKILFALYVVERFSDCLIQPVSIICHSTANVDLLLAIVSPFVITT